MSGSTRSGGELVVKLAAVENGQNGAPPLLPVMNPIYDLLSGVEAGAVRLLIVPRENNFQFKHLHRKYLVTFCFPKSYQDKQKNYQ